MSRIHDTNTIPRAAERKPAPTRLRKTSCALRPLTSAVRHAYSRNEVEKAMAPWSLGKRNEALLKVLTIKSRSPDPAVRPIAEQIIDSITPAM